MNKGGPIFIIEDDLDDQELLSDVFKSLDTKMKSYFLQTVKWHWLT